VNVPLLHSREGCRLPRRGQGAVRRDPYGEPVVPAATSDRLLAGCAVLLLAALAVVGVAQGAPRSTTALLAPTATCPGADDPSASPAVQTRALGCLVNWARHHDHRASLRQPASLRRAAQLKGRQVVACAAFSHTPCGADPAAAVRAAGYRYSTYGENLFFGPWGEVTAREVVAFWLSSPAHRANILRRSFRDLGATFVRAHAFEGGGDAVVWVAAFGARR